MALPQPLPDNPLRWDGWKNYNSDDLYARLGLEYHENPNGELIEENCRVLLVWWQKKLPLKSQPSNPLSQLLRGGLDEAPAYLAEARTKLLDGGARAIFDRELHLKLIAGALGEFRKLLSFAIGENRLREEDEQRLYQRGRGFGLARDEMQAMVEEELSRMGAVRVGLAELVGVGSDRSLTGWGESPMVVASVVGIGASEEFRRMLRLSKLCLEGDEMTDDQRDALCNMGESLGLSGGEAEDLIDEYLEVASGLPADFGVQKRQGVIVGVAAREPAVRVKTLTVVDDGGVRLSPVERAEEREKFPSFKNTLEMEMLLVSSGQFVMGSKEAEATESEQPLTPCSISCFYMARHLVTNLQYEAFDPRHVEKRASWSGDEHPVIYVKSYDAEHFCEWLSEREGKRYRLPTEAEWEYAARGSGSLNYPWGGRLDRPCYANFADRNKSFAWRDLTIDTGFSETSPVGSFPRGASPFGIEDMAGNVFEWCGDFFAPYKGKARTNPCGPMSGGRRVCRGGSWRSRRSSLRASARNFNPPEYASNDMGFRVICETAKI